MAAYARYEPKPHTTGWELRFMSARLRFGLRSCPKQGQQATIERSPGSPVGPWCGALPSLLCTTPL
eukprot:1150579-Pelagomonas_calceolata.AAC.1